ncbi:nitrogen fixation protein NifX [Methylobacter sp. Wu8]|jgi:nitrogen fixation protein NifX|uniref:Nitrogen fixation protein NifX n=1 Tax=Methylobacter tundripaludum TaxID=173365 RepID=A0A2S6GKP3_9GAMM|nr:nitrogen fixation protein NifX [Methylobacter tundripaludum]MCF7965522.1 nitrogen fixation protein NifX [Methylobacter tundripaludum]MCK9638076.1 nitrogen fixation protein NifX [Methylobacter tundripaludum]PPK65721.1 nitrogen fixation protein NifX [Methylobacter tundripaludum]
MNSQAISRELALRIGLAARALPDTDAKRLLSVLTDCIGLPLTEQKIAGIDLNALKSAKAGEFADVDEPLLTHALSILKSGLNAPERQAYTDGDMPGSVRIACASNDGINVDGHFGSCSQFLIYQVSADEARLIDIRNPDIPDGLEVDDKNAFRAELIQDCQVLYIASVGGPAAAKIVKLGIHPMKLPGIETIADIIKQLQTVIAGTPPPWLAKVMGVEASDRFHFEREATG